MAGAIAACGPTSQSSEVSAEAVAGPKLPCARGAASLAPVCTLTRERSGQGEIWTVRFPDGGFRRLRAEGNEIGAADGAEPLRSEGDDVVIGDEHYRLPDD
ncbi:hypothetical protein [Sphingomonas aerophila]|uniref:Uncharacterized protein n=1 Tax=Sphingomonas aerophila TaxID=1344948 RepID=A0A7W9BCT6_9SPHN|nr:hypothetical protein [Sphingomonas aerophila]MBB5714629.1 hypothetical protein [Sphingomonas aerophila]